jgi:calcium-dependent protein kinase
MFAVKSINKQTIIQKLEIVRRELDLMAQLDHPNVVKLYEIYEDAKYVHLVMDLCSGGDLLEYIMHDSRFTEFKAS